MVVNPGDMVVGDGDGVVAFPAAIGQALLEKYAFRWNHLNAFLALDSMASRARAAFM
jgi:regulator of RNase E activity RraA